MRADKVPLRDRILTVVRHAPGITAPQLARRLNRPRDRVFATCLHLVQEGVLVRDRRDQDHGWQYYVEHSMKTVLLVLLSFFSAASVYAQTPVFVLPTSSITFNASPDHSLNALDGTPLVSGYKANYCQQAAPTNCTVVPLGKPTPNASNVITIPNFFGQLTPNILWTVQIIATGPGGDSTATAGNAPFGMAIATTPRPVGNVIVVR